MNYFRAVRLFCRIVFRKVGVMKVDGKDVVVRVDPKIAWTVAKGIWLT